MRAYVTNICFFLLIGLSAHAGREIELDVVEEGDTSKAAQLRFRGVRLSGDSSTPDYLLEPSLWADMPHAKIHDRASGRVYWINFITARVESAFAKELPRFSSPNNVSEQSVSQDDESSPDEERICSAPVGHSDVKHLLRSSAYLRLGKGGAGCNGFRVSKTHLVTNKHCAQELVDVSRCGFPKFGSYTVTTAMNRCVDRGFKRILGRKLDHPVIASFVIDGQRVALQCNSLVAVTSADDLDASVLDCPDLASHPEVPVAKISQVGIRRSEIATIATWDFGDQNGLANYDRDGFVVPTQRIQSGTVVDSNRGNQMANLGSQAGNSGSSIFDRYHEVTAINWGAEVTDDKAFLKARLAGRNPQGRAQFNTFRDIFKDMRKTAPSVVKEIEEATRRAPGLCAREPAKQIAQPLLEAGRK